MTRPNMIALTLALACLPSVFSKKRGEDVEPRFAYVNGTLHKKVFAQPLADGQSVIHWREVTSEQEKVAALAEIEKHAVASDSTITKAQKRTNNRFRGGPKDLSQLSQHPLFHTEFPVPTPYLLKRVAALAGKRIAVENWKGMNWKGMKKDDFEIDFPTSKTEFVCPVSGLPATHSRWLEGRPCYGFTDGDVQLYIGYSNELIHFGLRGGLWPSPSGVQVLVVLVGIGGTFQPDLALYSTHESIAWYKDHNYDNFLSITWWQWREDDTQAIEKDKTVVWKISPDPPVSDGTGVAMAPTADESGFGSAPDHGS